METRRRSFAVLGLSKFGYRVATTLFNSGVEVVVIDRDRNLIQKISDGVTRAVQGDATDEDTLEHLGVFDVDVVVIGFRSSFDAAVLLTLLLRKRREDIQIVAQVDTDEKAEALRQLGGNITVFPERDIADRLVKRLMTTNLMEHIELAPDVAVIECPVPVDFVGKSLSELDVRAKHKVHVIGVLGSRANRLGDPVTVAPSADRIFMAQEILLLLGRIEDLNRFSAVYRT